MIPRGEEEKTIADDATHIPLPDSDLLHSTPHTQNGLMEQECDSRVPTSDCRLECLFSISAPICSPVLLSGMNAIHAVSSLSASVHDLQQRRAALHMQRDKEDHELMCVCVFHCPSVRLSFPVCEKRGKSPSLSDGVNKEQAA